MVGRSLKWGGIGLGSLVLLALVLFAVAYAINLRDEPLSPRATALLEPPHNPYRDEDNLYVALLGLDAPAGESVVAAGRSRVDRYNSRLDAQLRDPLAVPSENDDPRRLQFQGKFAFPQPSGSYWKEIPPRRQELGQLLAGNRELYERYLALHRLHGYFQTARPSILVPIASVAPTGVRQLFLANVVLRMRGDDPRARQQALSDLEDDVRLWRVMLIADGTFVAKMLAIAYLHQDEQLLADAIADPRAAIPLGADDAEAVAPLFPPHDWNIGNAYAGEFLVQRMILEQMRTASQSGWVPPDAGRLERFYDRIGIEMHFLQFNASLNLFAEQADRLMRAAAPGAVRLAGEAPANPVATIRVVYNPVGKILVAIAEPGYADYPLRAWDGAAFQRLVRLSYEIRRLQIDAAAIPAFMVQHPEWSTHPSDGRAFVWDGGGGTIRVQNLGNDRSGRVYFVHLWRPSPPG